MPVATSNRKVPIEESGTLKFQSRIDKLKYISFGPEKEVPIEVAELKDLENCEICLNIWRMTEFPRFSPDENLPRNTLCTESGFITKEDLVPILPYLRARFMASR
ncbi:hypothetical protein TNCV_688271 [Trichonephila clavipes]|nr:hypothetical protein TNCV_688271 [Trichonephila clavipes]